MARVLITGSADGLGRAAAQALLEDGHDVIVHARNTDRLKAIHDLMDRGAGQSSATCPTWRRHAGSPTR